MDYRSMLVRLLDSDSARQRLDIALALAVGQGAHPTGRHLGDMPGLMTLPLLLSH